MGVGDWITLAAVIVALGIGVASILYTQNLQKKERRERLLNEIIEWAIDVTSVNFGGEIIVTPGVNDKIQRRREDVNRLLQCQVLEVKGKELIKPYALSINKELSDAVSQIISSLIKVIAILTQGVPYTESKEANEALISNDSVLGQNIRNLLNKVSKYRT